MSVNGNRGEERRIENPLDKEGVVCCCSQYDRWNNDETDEENDKVNEG